MERLNLNHFFYFMVVAKEGSIKSASEKLHVTQPTISDQLKLLEDFVQCPLFDRQGKKLILNSNGKLALEYAERIFDLSKEVLTKLRHPEGQTKGTLDIGITNHMSQYFIYETIEPLFSKSQLKLKFTEGERLHLLAKLESDQVDVVFTDNREQLSNQMDAYKVGVNRTFAVGHKKFSFGKSSFPQGLSGLPFFNYTSESSLKFEIELYFRKHGITPQIIGETDDIDLFQMVTEKAHAFTIVPEAAMSRFSRAKDVVILGELLDLQTTVWGVIKSNYRGYGYRLLNRELK